MLKMVRRLGIFCCLLFVSDSVDAQAQPSSYDPAQHGTVEWKKMELSNGNRGTFPVCASVTVPEGFIELRMPSCSGKTSQENYFPIGADADMELYFQINDNSWQIARIDCSIKADWYTANGTWEWMQNIHKGDQFPYLDKPTEIGKEYVIAGTGRVYRQVYKGHNGVVSFAFIGENLSKAMKTGMPGSFNDPVISLSSIMQFN